MKTARTAIAGMTLAELERRIVQNNETSRFTRAKASRLELGYADATWSEIELIAGVLNVSPYWLANIASPVAPAEPPAAITSSDTEAETEPPATAPTSNSANATTPAIAGSSIPAEVPPRGNRSAIDYHRLLSAEKMRAEEQLHRRGTSADEWRRWRDYHRLVMAAFDKLNS